MAARRSAATVARMLTCFGQRKRDQQIRVSCETELPVCLLKENRRAAAMMRRPVCTESCRAENAVRHKTTCNKLNTFGIDRRTTYHLHKKTSHSTNTRHERERQKCECDCVGGSRTRLPVPLLTTRAPWDTQLSWTWQTS